MEPLNCFILFAMILNITIDEEVNVHLRNASWALNVIQPILINLVYFVDKKNL